MPSTRCGMFGGVKSARSPRKKRKAPAATRGAISKSDRAKILRSMKKHDEVGRLLAEWDRNHPAGK